MAKSPYDLAVDYVRGRVSVSAPNLARDCQITPGTARSWLRMMQRDGVVAEANEVGRHLVLKPMPRPDELELPDALSTYQHVIDASAAESLRTIEAIREGAPNPEAAACPPSMSRARQIIEAMLRLKSEADEINAHLAEIRKSAKDEGHHVKALNKIVERLRAGPHKHAELEGVIDIYVAQLLAEGAYPELADLTPAPISQIETHH